MSKFVEANEKIAEKVVEGYKKIESGAVEGFNKVKRPANAFPISLAASAPSLWAQV